MTLHTTERIRAAHTLLKLILIFMFSSGVQAQDRHDWTSLAQLRPGDRIRLSLKAGHVEGLFQAWTSEQVAVGPVKVSKEDVLEIERYRPGAWGRGKKALAGAVIGFGVGFAVGAIGAGNCSHDFVSPCFSRADTGGFVGLSFSMVGAGIGALLPVHTKETIFSLR